VVGHEYFHNWSGNRVTCRDWFQLTLKEGFTVYRDQVSPTWLGLGFWLGLGLGLGLGVRVRVRVRVHRLPRPG
jgi:hypothetical protein